MEKRQHRVRRLRGDEPDSLLSLPADLWSATGDNGLNGMTGVIKVDPCAFSSASPQASGGRKMYSAQPTPRCVSQCSSVPGEQMAPHTNQINLYALFPGWHHNEHLSVRDFIVDWLIGFFKVPLTSDGWPWIKELELPVLNIKCGGISAKCSGISAAQEAIIRGKCTMSVLPWRAHGEEEKAFAAEAGGSEEAWDALLDQRGVMQVMCAYYESSLDGGAVTRTSSAQERICEPVNSSGMSGVGKYQAVLRNDGMVFVDLKHLRRTSPQADTLVQTISGSHAESARSAVLIMVNRLEGELIVQLAAGSNHFLCLTSEGRIFAFGCSMQGQMGFQATSSAAVWNIISIHASSKGSMLPFGAKVVQVACGANHSLAVVDNGLVYGFGNNANGQVGLPGSVEIHKPTVLLKFERMSSAALLNAKGVYVRSDFDVVSTDIPWVVAAACGDRHSVFLTASGQIFACGDNSSGQIGYSGSALRDQDDAFENMMDETLGKELAVTDANICTSEILQFQVPILLEGGHVPKTASMVACGSSHTSVLSHSGRVYIYGGVPKRMNPDPPSKSRYSGNLAWRTEHDPNLHLDADAYSSSLVYHGDPEKIVNIVCCGDLTLATYFKTSEASGHNSPSVLDRSVFWWGAGDNPSLLQLRYRIPTDLQRGFCLKSDAPFKLSTLEDSRESDALRQSQGSNSPAKVENKDKLLEEMKEILSLLRHINSLYMACRSIYPAVREEAVTLWASADRFCIEAERKLSFMKTSRSLSEIVNQITQNYDLTKSERRQLVMSCQLIAYRTTQKRCVMDQHDLEYFYSIGISGMWRPHLLHDQLWSGTPNDIARDHLVNTKLAASMGSHPGPFMLLAEDVLDKKLEAASVGVYSDQKSIMEAVKDLSPRVDLALLFLSRRGNVSVNSTNTAILQMLSKEYFVVVKTGSGPNSATDSRIFIEIVGTNGSSGERSLLYSDNANAFESGQTDIFSLSCTELGHIKKVVVRNEGDAVKSIWKLDEIRIWQAGNEKLVYDFPFFGWMDPRIPGDYMRQELWYDPVDLARERYDYQLRVQTHDKVNAGTSAGVFCTLYGEQADSKRQRLDETESGRTNRLFQRASTDTFLVPVAADLGNLSKLVIGVTSWGGPASWILDSVEVKRLRKGAGPDEARAAPVTRFYYRSETPIGLKRGYCQVELYPESDAKRSEKNNIPQPLMTPAEGSYELPVDVYTSSPEVNGEVLVTAIFLPDSDSNARVRGNDWIEARENYPGARSSEASVSENAVPLELMAPEQVHAQRPSGAEDTSTSDEKRIYVLPDSFYATDDSSVEGTVTYKMPTNSTLRLTRYGTYRIMVRSVKFVLGSFDLSDVTKTGDIIVRNRRAQARYRVSVFTGNFPEAGTTANVSVILQGEDGSRTSVLDLNSSARLAPQNTAEQLSSKACTDERRLSAAAKAQAFLETGHRKFNQMVNPFGRNSEAVFELVAEDVGAVGEVTIWHDNTAHPVASLNPLSSPAWYLHRVEVVNAGCPSNDSKEGVACEDVGEDDKRSRVFVCRKWLTSRDAKLGTRARLVYKDLQQHESIIHTYDFAIVVPKKRLVDMKQKSLPFDSLVLFGERVPLGAKIALPKGRVERVITNESVMFCFKQQLGQYMGTLWRAMFVKGVNDFEPAFKGLRLLVTCYERAAYNTVHLVPSLVDDSLANTTLANVTASCSAVPWATEYPLKSVLRVSDRQQAAEPAPNLNSSQPDEEPEEDEIVPYAAGLQKVRADRPTDSRVLLLSLEIWLNIFMHDEFDDEVALQEMIPACTRMNLVQVAKRGLLQQRHLSEHGKVFMFEVYPIQLVREMEAHRELAIMNSVVLNFDKWRSVQSNSYELEEISPAQGFAWNLLYWTCCTNPPDQQTVAFIIRNGDFETLDDDGENSLFHVDGLQADFALLLHYIVLRQMAKEDVLQEEEAHAEALLRKFATGDENLLSFKRRLMRLMNKCVRAVVFPFLLVLVVVHVLLNIIFSTVSQCLWIYWKDWLMFSKFTDASVLQPTRKESRRIADQWRKTCTGNFKWLSRRWPITQEERRRREKKLLLVGPWNEFWFECRRHFMMILVPYLSKVRLDMSKWFMVGTTEHSTFHSKTTGVRSSEG